MVTPASTLFALMSTYIPSHLATSQVWTHWSRTDEFTDEVRHIAGVEPSEGDGAIGVVCYQKDHSVRIIVSTGIYLGIKADKLDKKPVRYRVDSGATVRTLWPGAEMNADAIEPQSLAFARALLEGQSHVVVELTSWNGDSRRSKFPLKNSRRAIGAVLDRCGK